MPAATGYGDTVPSAFAMVRQSIARLFEHRSRSIRVREFRLLHQKNVRPGSIKPPQDFLKASFQRVDVPGRDSHVYRLSDVERAAPASQTFQIGE